MLLVVAAVAVDHVRMDVVERLHKRFVLTFVDADVVAVDIDDVGVVVPENLHHCYSHCYCYCYGCYRKSLVLSSV